MDPLRDRLIDHLLEEELGGDTPPDLTEKILAQASPRPRRWRVALVCAAAAVLLATTIWLVLREGYPAPAASGDFVVVGGGPVERGAVLRTGQQAAALNLGGYAHIELEPDSLARIDGMAGAEAIFLESGAVTCDVATGKGAFTVNTPVGTVSVVGTKFRVYLITEEEEPEMNQKMTVSVLAGAVLVSGIWGMVQVSEGQQRTFIQEKHAGDLEDGKKGTTVGVLVKKEKNAIYVKAHGEEQPRRFVPHWRGGLPAQGGGLDKEMLKTFEKLKVGSRIEVEWIFVERLRAEKIKVLHLPDGHHDHKKEHDKPKPGLDKRTGVTTGTLVTREAGKELNGWIEVKGDGEEKARKYFYYKPSAKLLETVRHAPLGSRVAVEWVFTNHGPQALRLEVVGKRKE